MAALVHTWHDDASSPGLIACVPSDYRLLERRQSRSDDTLLMNHGVGCLLCDASLHMCRVQLPTFSIFEVICIYASRSAFNAVVASVYHPGSVKQAFFHDFYDLLDSLAIY